MAASDYVPTFFKKPLALGGASTDEYTPYARRRSQTRQKALLNQEPVCWISVADHRVRPPCNYPDACGWKLANKSGRHPILHYTT
jgi:hypothetical protein